MKNPIDYIIWINIARFADIVDEKKVEKYSDYIKYYSEQWIRLIRIIFVPWWIDPLNKSKHIMLFLDILNICKLYNIKVIISLNHFTSFSQIGYREFESNEYLLCKMRIDHSWILDLLDTIYANLLGNTIDTIELFNEIDLISLQIRKSIISQINQLYLSIKEKYKCNCAVSISNHLTLKWYQKRLLVKIDAHSYWYPYHCILENLLYFKSKNACHYMSEYAKYSDYFRDDIDSLICFASWLRWWYIIWLYHSPLYWWRDSLYKKVEYEKALKCFQEISSKLVKPKIINSNIIKAITLWVQENKSYSNSQKESKWLYRLKKLIQNPSAIVYEYNAILKYIQKIFFYRKKYKFILIEGDNWLRYLLLETYSLINELQFNEYYHKVWILNLLTWEKHNSILIIKNKCIFRFHPWCYIIALFTNEKDSLSF